LADLAKFNFDNNGDGDVKVTQVKLKRIGVSADASLTAVYLFDGAKRLTDSASVSSGIITFNDSTGIFTVEDGSSKTITVKSDLAATAGETLGVSLNAVSDITSNASDVSGSYPIKGNLMSVASAALAGVSFGATTTPSINTSLSPQDEYIVWQNTVTFTTRAVDMTRMSFRAIGSINYSDLQNFKLYISGTQVGSTVENLDDAGYVTFDLSASPKRIEAGGRTVKLMADVINGSSRTFYFSIRNSADANFIDSEYSLNVLPKSDSDTFTVSHVTAGVQTVGSGTLTVTKTTSSPSGNIVNGAPAATLAEYELKASGERVKIESLKIATVISDASASYLRNGMLLANGVQVGSTSALYDTGYSTGYTTFNLGASLEVEPGSPVTLKIVADVYDSDGTNDIAADVTITARIVSNTSNAIGKSSSTTVDVPASNTDGNQLTVKEGSLTFAKYTAYTNQTAVAPLNDYKLAHFTLTADTTEAVNLNTITVTLDAVSSYASDLWVKYGTKETSLTSSVAVSNSYSVNYALGAGETIDVEVHTNVSSGMTSSTGQASVLIAGTTADSSSPVYTGADTTGTTLAGQTISFSSVSFSTGNGDDTPDAQIVSGGQTITAAEFKFTSLYDESTLKEVKVKLNDPAGATISGAIIGITLKDGATDLGTSTFNESSQVDDTGTVILNSATTFTGLNIKVPSNSTKTLTVELELSTPVADVGTSQVDVAMTLDSVKYASSQGVETTSATDSSGEELLVYKSIPVFAAEALTSGEGIKLESGSATELYKFQVSSEGDSIALKQIRFSTTVTDNSGVGTDVLDTFKFFRGDTDITTSSVTIQNTSGDSLEGATDLVAAGTTDIIVTFDTEQIISAGTTGSRVFTLKATPTGFTGNSTGRDSVSTSIPGTTDTAVGGHNGTAVYVYDSGTGTVHQLSTDNSASGLLDCDVIWSDKSALSHSYTSASSSADWANGYKVTHLPLGSAGVSAGL